MIVTLNLPGRITRGAHCRLGEPDAPASTTGSVFEETGERVDSRVPGGPRFPVLQMQLDV
jgi:hypothetical protein